MISRPTNANNFADNSFDQDIAQLLEGLSEGSDIFEADRQLDELASWFEEEVSDSPAEETYKKTYSEKSTLSSLPSEDEINQLFRDDFTWDDTDKELNTIADESPDTEADLSSLLGGDSWEQNNIESDSSFLRQMESMGYSEENSDLENLKYLLESPDEEKRIEPNHSLPHFYPTFEQLEGLLRQPAGYSPSECVDEETAAQLAALIETSPSVPKEEETSVETLEITSEVEIDDEFRELEALLEQADRTMGGSPTLLAGKGQRLQPRPRPSKTKVFEQTMRVPVKQLDNLSNLIGELVVKRNSLEQDQERLRHFLDNLLNQVQNLSDVGGRMQDLYERTLLEGALLASRNQGQTSGLSNLIQPQISETSPTIHEGEDRALDALEMDRFTGFHLLSQEMIELIVRVRESASDIQFLVDETEQVARSLRQATTQLQEGMTNSRMVPFAQTADRLPRAVREISMKLNKQVKLLVEGREVLVDKMILEHLYNPMTHLVNNAITHGIEDPSVRKKSGKFPEGHINLRAFLQGNQTVITISDDGGGIDPELVKAKAIEKDLITPEEAKTLTEVEIYDFLFHAGFSTRDKADDFAGRGVGLDVVRTSLIDVRGSVSIDSTRGKGTTFTIRLPLTLSICKALCCLSDRARIAFPMDGVEDMKDYVPSDLIIDENGQECINWNNSMLPVYSLGDLLSYNRQLGRGSVYGGKNEDDTVSLVILRGTGNFLAVRVDQVIGEQEIVIKQIEGPIPKPAGIAGATVLGDGTIMPIGDVLELMEIAQGRLRTDGNSSIWKKTPLDLDLMFGHKTEPMVLIIDDSITVRELLSLSFSKSGYQVEQARDGQEAWEKLRSGLPCDLVFCDIEMPRMNGLELLSNIQKDPQLSDIPVALLTSRGADRHRKVAAKLGASGYFTKPCPDQTLLEAAQRMLQGEVLLAGSHKKPRKQRSSGNQDSSSGNNSQTTHFSDEEQIVLIVDDSVMVREMLSMTFTKTNYRVEQARDGQEAWEKLRGGLFCHLILCDIEMPRMNGLELLSRLQADEQLAKIPIAMITSRGAQKMQKIAAERGAKGYFVKPYIEAVLLDAAQRLIAGEVLLDINALVES
ncbi:hybrid sensor histidine kinase/response regulator [Aphanothece sacrum]|uniref:histidine kinase n=1 Tax=Aphanothece sacrum FPU1 TaxID=1920663 RepID=A0A401IBU0_APHSA|nr:hybrid sensor histidine kinase/response regulator [Aphanothece sacrum]GBF78696.1 two-component sensor histidine kinase [Aphanothece sacrum FPU1]GBF84985.1 two-component sensor histidine kinase [Aphanothece sacrum FPU3]